MPAEVKKEIQLEIAHVLFIDIVGYSKLLINEQRALLDTLNQVVRGTDQFRSAEAAGRLIKIPTGDGMALVFYNSPEAPVECALEISRGLKLHPELQLRMGVHSGPVSGVIDVNERANVAGAGINVAQRVMDCGDAGHILLSKHVAEDLEHYGHWQPHLHDLGECEVKHGTRVSVVNLYTEELGNPQLPEKFKQAAQKPVATAVVTPAGASAPSKRGLIVAAVLLAIALALGFVFLVVSHRAAPKSASTSEKSIAVLPFENRSEDKANAYFADGIQDEILTRLAKIADLKVISRTSTQHYKSAPENLPEIAKQLGVTTVLEGSVQKAGEQVRINVQLINSQTDSHLWAESYDRKLTDIFIVESEVAKTIADTLRAQLTGREEKAIAVKPTANPEAYDAFLRGRASEALQVVSFKSRFIAADFYTKAVSLDADFALAWARLGMANALLYRLGQDHTPQRREQARQAAETALRLQPDLGEAHLALGYYFFHCLSDYDNALQLLDQALTLLPNNTDAIATIGFIKRRQGKFSEALAQLERATELDPRNLTPLRELAGTHALLRQFAQARAIYNRALEIVPNDLEMIAEKAHTYLEEGDLAAAAKLLGPVLSESLDNHLLKVQIIQLIFERKYAPASAALKAAIARADKTLGVEIGAYYLLLLVAQQGSGDTEAARQTCEQGLQVFSAMHKAGNESEFVAGFLGLFYAAVGNRDAAMSEARRAAAVAAHDALNAAATEEMLARTQVQLGDFDAAISSISHNLQGPSATFGWGMPLTRATLKIDPTWDPLRGDPRFEKIVASLAPKEAKP